MFTIGADPEFFVTDAAGVVTPIVGLLGGTKDKPIPVGGVAGFAVQEDNVMAEYNIPACSDPDTFASYITHGRNFALQAVRRNLPGAEAFRGCAYLFSGEQLANPQAQMFGCSPDFDAYNMGAPLARIQPHALMEGEGAWRFSGGHIHLGYKGLLNWQPPDFVVAALCDLLISIPMIAYGFDEQGQRRRWYGTPGRYRPTSYGVEYRTLCNSWTLTGRASLYAGYTAFSVMTLLSKGETEVRRVYNDVPWRDVRATISSEDRNTATALRRFAQDYGLEVT